LQIQADNTKSALSPGSGRRTFTPVLKLELNPADLNLLERMRGKSLEIIVDRCGNLPLKLRRREFFVGLFGWSFPDYCRSFDYAFKDFRGVFWFVLICCFERLPHLSGNNEGQRFVLNKTEPTPTKIGSKANFYVTNNAVCRPFLQYKFLSI
jgi:hypothetical protein